MSKAKVRDVASSTPGFVWVGAALGLAFLLLPLVGLVRRVAWRGLLGNLVEGPASSNVKAMYGIASIRGSKIGSLARAFVDFVLSEQGWRILKGFGFQKP